MIFEQEKKQDSAAEKVWKRLHHTRFLTERVVTVIPFPWYFMEFRITGETARKTNFEAMDEIVCGMLLRQEGLPLLEMAGALGLNDGPGHTVLKRMIKPLSGTMIRGDESYYELSERGRELAKEGYKFTLDKVQFQLRADLQETGNVKPEDKTLFQCRNLDIHHLPPIQRQAAVNMATNIGSLEQLRKFAAAQAPKVHHPERGMYLEGGISDQFSYQRGQILIGVLHDFDENEVRYEAFSPDGEKNLAGITSWLNGTGRETLQPEIERVIRSINDREVFEGDKNEEQEDDEAHIVHVVSVAKSLPEQEQKMELERIAEERKSFDTISFEEEIEWLAVNCKHELWLISPWIRSAAIRHRKAQIEKALNNGARVFVGYSEPHRAGEAMVQADDFQLLTQLSEKHPAQFFFAELPQFHEKIILADGVEGKKYEYTGSFNMLSFSAHGQAKIGRENMRRIRWDEGSEAHHAYQKSAFAHHYLRRCKESLMKSAEVHPDQDAIRKAAEGLKNAEKFLPYLRYAGGETQLQAETALKAATESIQHARRMFCQSSIQKATQQVRSGNSPTSFREELLKLIRENGFAEKDFSEELHLLEREWQARLTENSIRTLEKEIQTLGNNLTEKEREKWLRKVAELRNRIGAEIATETEERLKSLEELIRSKAAAPAVGLKIVGKIELPKDKKSKRR